METSTCDVEDCALTWSGSQPCQGITLTPPPTSLATLSAHGLSYVLQNLGLPGEENSPEEDPSSWPDLQPWLRGMCPSVGLAPDAGVVAHDKEAIKLSDLQFRISRLELQF